MFICGGGSYTLNVVDIDGNARYAMLVELTIIALVRVHEVSVEPLYEYVL